MHAFDRRTDRILMARPRLHSMQRVISSVLLVQQSNIIAVNLELDVAELNYIMFNVFVVVLKVNWKFKIS